MNIYLPVAEMSVNALMILFFGVLTGMLSGLFGVGGGFLMTPLLIFSGVPAPVAAASSANQIIGASFSGVLAHWRKGHVDLPMGLWMTGGGLVGAACGVTLFRWFQKTGQLDLAIALCYVFFLGGVSLYMAQESLRALLKRGASSPAHEEKSFLPACPDWPLQVSFARSGVRVSLLLPLLLGALAGVLVSMMGIGGGFLLIPAMIYVLGMPTSMTIGTSLFQILGVTTAVTLMQATSTRTVDIVLVVLMLAGSVTGAQLGARLAGRLNAEKMRLTLALLALATAGKLAFGLFSTPASLYTVIALP